MPSSEEGLISGGGSGVIQRSISHEPEKKPIRVIKTRAFSERRNTVADVAADISERGLRQDKMRMFVRRNSAFIINFVDPMTEKVATPNTELDDPWAIQDLEDDTKPWDELTSTEKLIRVLIAILKFFSILTLLYFFIISLDVLSLSFRLLGGRTTGKIFQESDLVSNPIVGLMIGVLTTVLVQSSSTSSSIIVSMVSADFIKPEDAIYLIFGSNIGTSVTSTIVSLTQAGDKNQFRRAFAGATVHDAFNWMSVILLLIVEVSTGLINTITKSIVDSINTSSDTEDIEILGRITKPLVNLIVQLNSSTLTCWSQPEVNGTSNNCSETLIKNCDLVEEGEKCTGFIFQSGSMSDALIGGILLIASLAVLCTCLILIVRILNTVLKGYIAKAIKKILNSDIPHAPFLTGYLALAVGAFLTFCVQSSSIFTSSLTPLIGLGIISLDRSYPLILGSNIGTTTTALLASLAVDGNNFKPSLQVALAHLFFNIFGILIFYPIPFMRVPIKIAKILGNTTANYRWFAVFYLFFMFMLLPCITIGLSYLGKAMGINMALVIAFVAIVLGIIVFVSIVNILRKKKPSVLPKFLLSWDFLPEILRSLDPLDRLFSRVACLRKLNQNIPSPSESPKKLSLVTEQKEKEANGKINTVFEED